MYNTIYFLTVFNLPEEEQDGFEIKLDPIEYLNKLVLKY